MDQRLTIITIGVEDLKAMTTFYETAFGWKTLSSSNEQISFFKLNGILLSLYPKEDLALDAEVSSEGSGFNGFAMAFNVNSIQEVNELFEDLKQKGVQIIKPPQNAFWGGYSGYVCDIEGNLWEIAYNPFLNLDESGNVTD